jgi:glycosyl transferase family 25
MKKYILGVFLVILLAFLAYPLGYFVLDGYTKTEIKENNNYVKDSVVAYIINLDRSPERLKFVKENVERLNIPFERISAVDGNLLSQEEIQQKVSNALKGFDRRNKVGIFGCYLSHVKTWEIFLKSDAEFAIIFEDDVNFNPKILKETIDELIINKKLWDINTFDIRGNGMPLKIKRLSNGQKLVVYLTRVVNAGAYIINRKAAERLVQKALPIKMQVDDYFTRIWELDLKFTGIENPRLVYQMFGNNSDIEETNKIDNDKVDFITLVKRRIYQSQRAIIRFIYNLKVYLQDKE